MTMECFCLKSAILDSTVEGSGRVEEEEAEGELVDSVLLKFAFDDDDDNDDDDDDDDDDACPAPTLCSCPRLPSLPLLLATAAILADSSSSAFRLAFNSTNMAFSTNTAFSSMRMVMRSNSVNKRCVSLTSFGCSLHSEYFNLLSCSLCNL